MTDWRHCIVADPAILVGKPVVRDTRLAVDFILGLFASGWTEEKVLENYPDLSRDALRAVFAFAAERGNTSRLLTTSCSPAAAILSASSTRWMACLASAATNPWCRCTRSPVVTIGTSIQPPPRTTSTPTANTGISTHRKAPRPNYQSARRRDPPSKRQGRALNANNSPCRRPHQRPDDLSHRRSAVSLPRE